LKRAIYQTFFLIHTLSLDIALGAMGLGIALLKIFTHTANASNSLNPSQQTSFWLPIQHLNSINQINPITAIILLLFIGTLVVYWTDHIQDSKNVQMVVSGERHALFFRHRRWFELGLGVLILLASWVSLSFLTWIQLGFGILLLGLHIGYLMFHRRFSRRLILEKELWVGLLYTMSILFVPLAVCMPLGMWQWFELILLGLLVFLVCMQNLFSIARMEREADEAMGIRNGVVVFGELRMKDLQKLMLLLQVVSSLLLLLGSFIANLEDAASTGEIVGTSEIASTSNTATISGMASQALSPNTGDATWLMFKILSIFMIVGLVNYLLPWLFGSDRKNSWYRIVGDGVFLLFFLV
jgi:hypothetical protein